VGGGGNKKQNKKYNLYKNIYFFILLHIKLILINKS
jgi:hypothetical protein